VNVMPRVDRIALNHLEQTLHHEIPLTRAMGIRVVCFDEQGLMLSAPLAANINHKHTAFGGSLATLTTLAGWGLLHLLLREHPPATIVIQDSHTHYRRPVTDDFTATCALPDSEVLVTFLETLGRRGMARIDLTAGIPVGGRPAVEFEGRFVALNNSRTPATGPQSIRNRDDSSPKYS
jgi:thioesterase domain-containing protein